MRIAYVAKHRQENSNDDEGGIKYVLEQLGHTVVCFSERLGKNDFNRYEGLRGYDFVLFHKWDNVELMRECKVPIVFWYFDLVNYPDQTLYRRNNHRMQWMEKIIPLVKVGFCTDGNWIEFYGKSFPNKYSSFCPLYHLPQGADERMVGMVEPTESIPILFTGITNGGIERERFVKAMKGAYGDQFRQVERGVHGTELRQLVANAQIVVAPSGPVTDRYWSNRVYLTLGFGGFLLHPKCQGLQEDFCNQPDGKEIVFYRDIQHLFELISYYRSHPDNREHIALGGYEQVKAHHLYRHRCEKLIEIVKERIGYGG